MPDFETPILHRGGYDYRRAFGYEMKRWRSRLGYVLSNNGVARVWVCGDSILEGFQQTNATTRIQTLLRRALQQIYRPGGPGYITAVQGWSPYTVSDWTFAGSPPTYVDTYGFGAGRRSQTLTGAGQSLTYTWVGDRCWILYTQGTAVGGMKVTLDGVAQAVVGTNNAAAKSGRVWDSGQLAVGTHTVKVEPDNSLSAPNNILSLFIDGGLFFNADYSNGIVVVDSCHASYQASHFAGTGGIAVQQYWSGMMDTMPPDLMLLEFGLNELYNNYSPTTMKTDLQNLVSWAKTSGAPSDVSVVVIPLWGMAYGKRPGGHQLTTNGTTTITSTTAQFSAGDVGLTVTGTNIPASTTIVSVTPMITAAGVSSAVISNAATGSGSANNLALVGRITKFVDAEWTPYRQALYDVALANGWAVWDMYALFQFIGTDPELITADYLHPNDKGAAILATELATLLIGAPGPLPLVNKGDYNAKGDLLVGTADNIYARQGVGSDPQVLIADSSQATGVRWGPPPLDHGYCGDGVDGAIVFDGSSTITLAGGATLVPSTNVYTLTRDLFATTIVVNNGVTVKTNNFRIYAKTSFTINAGGIVDCSGNNAVGATGGAALTNNVFVANAAGGTATTGAGAVGGAQGTAQSFGGAGGGGGGSGTGAPTAGGVGTSQTGWATSLAGGTAGAAGTGGTAGGVGGATTMTLNRGFPRVLPFAASGMANNPSGAYVLSGSAGAAAGAGDGTNVGGGGGSGAGVILICSPIIINNGTIRANGGNGANATAGNAGGGGGGGGGVIVLVGMTITAGTLQVNGGTAGTGFGVGKNGGVGGTGTTFVETFS